MSNVVKNIGHYLLGKTIGEGTFGKVKLGTHILSGEKVAIKILEKEKIKEQADLERVAREINILKKLRHPNIIQLFEIVETPRSLYLIMEYAEGGELFEYIVKNQRVPEKQAANFLLQILSGIDYIHQLKVVHRDLKPENLLFDQNLNIKIVDFGLSNTYLPEQQLKTACGSPCYAAPEMIAGKKYFGLQVDIWSCGVILFAMLCGYLPFEDPVTANLYKKIIAGDYQIPKFIPQNARELIKGILNTDTNQRFTIHQIINHPWMTSNFSSIKLTPGLALGIEANEISDCILQQMQTQNFNIDYTKQCLENNRHNHVTTTYLLLKQKNLRNPQQPFQQPSSKIAEQTNETDESRLSNYQVVSQSPPKNQTPSHQRTRSISQKEENLQINKQEIVEKEPISAIPQPIVIQPRTTRNVHTRQVSVSTEKHPENLFPTAQQIIEKAQRFRNQAISNTQQDDYNSLLSNFITKDNKTSLKTEEDRQQNNSKSPKTQSPIQRPNHNKENKEEIKNINLSTTPETMNGNAPIPSARNGIIQNQISQKSPNRFRPYQTRMQSPRDQQRKITSNSPISNGTTFSSKLQNNLNFKDNQSVNIKIHRGPYNLQQVSSKMPSLIMNNIYNYLNLRCFTILNVKKKQEIIKQVKKYELKVQLEELKFDIIVSLLLNTDNIYVIKGTKLQGSSELFEQQYKEMLNFINK